MLVIGVHWIKEERVWIAEDVRKCDSHYGDDADAAASDDHGAD